MLFCIALFFSGLTLIVAASADHPDAKTIELYTNNETSCVRDVMVSKQDIRHKDITAYAPFFSGEAMRNLVESEVNYQGAQG